MLSFIFLHLELKSSHTIIQLFFFIYFFPVVLLHSNKNYYYINRNVLMIAPFMTFFVSFMLKLVTSFMALFVTLIVVTSFVMMLRRRFLLWTNRFVRFPCSSCCDRNECLFGHCFILRNRLYYCVGDKLRQSSFSCYELWYLKTERILIFCKIFEIVELIHLSSMQKLT